MRVVASGEVELRRSTHCIEQILDEENDAR